MSATSSTDLLRVSGLRPRSLRARLMLLLMLGIAAMWLVTAMAMYREARRSAEALFDAELAHTADLLLAIAEHELLEEKESPAEFQVGALGEAGRTIAYQLFDSEQRMLARSFAAPAKRMMESQSGYADTEHGGRRWRVVSVWDRLKGLEVQVGTPHGLREEQGSSVALQMVLPFAVGFPLVAVVSWLVISRGLRPLDIVTRQLSGRAPHDLQPLTLAQAPSEILPLVVESNRLFQRVQETMAAEKRFTADAAHELRTPLAAIRAQAQVALRAGTEADRTGALRQLITGVDRATHLIDELLLLARLDPGGGEFEQSLVDLEQVAAAALEEVRDTAIARHIRLEQRTLTAQVIGNASALKVLFRNLLDNAIRYTPEGGRVQLLIERQHRAALVSVLDSGPGLSSEEREHVFDRFYRVRGTPQSGSGLGMSIVKRAVELHNGSVELGAGIDGAGLGVTVRIPV